MLGQRRWQYTDIKKYLANFSFSLIKYIHMISQSSINTILWNAVTSLREKKVI